jgi:hypothetical protein
LQITEELAFGIRFLLSSYEIWESIGFSSGKSKFFFCFFSRFRTIIPKKNMFRAKKKIRLSRGVAAAVDKNFVRIGVLHMTSYSKFEIYEFSFYEFMNGHYFG